MRIAIIGYGSLIWDLENLEPHVSGSWNIGGGPQMPVEFSRISPKRKKALVLVIDETLGHACKTCVIASNRNNLDEAVADLARRERCPHDAVGVVTERSTASCGVPAAVHNWLGASAFDAAIWTSLPANFHSETGEQFTHARGVDYLKTLKGESLGEAWRYIEYAPAVTSTPFRRHLAQDSFWQSLNFSGPS